VVGRVTGPAVDLYGALAPTYDAWQSCDGMIPFAEVVRAKLEPLLRAQAACRAEGSPPFAFLDVACGTGTLLSGLRGWRSGWRLAGVDGSAAMLAVAAAKPAGPTIAWARAALDAPLPFTERFDVVGCFYDALNHLTDTAALRRAIGSMAAVLRPGGLLVFDVTNQDGFARWWRGRRQFAGDDWQMAIQMRFDPDRQQGLADVEIARGGQAIGPFELVERHFPRPAIQEAVAKAGLVPVLEQPWAPFDGDLAGKTWWVVRRGSE
jgi:SAM-dependent methyltransferase